MTETAPSVVIIARAGSLSDLPSALGYEGIESRTVEAPDDVAGALAQNAQCVAVLDAEIPQAEAFSIYKMLHQDYSIPTLLVVPPESYRAFLLDPARADNDECVSKPVDADELVLRIKALMLRAGYHPPVPSANRHTDTRNGAHADAQGKIVTVFHAKGGVGASTIASNLAVGLARFNQARTLLVDTDLWFGDLGVLLNTPTHKSLFDALGNEDYEINDIRSALVPHETGLYLLLRPEDPYVVERLEPTVVVQTIGKYRAIFDYIVVDTQPSLNEITLQLLDMSQLILLITTPEIAAAHNSARFLKIADAIGYSDKIVTILNRANSGIRTELLEQHLNVNARIALPSAGRLVVDSANQGTPILSVADPELLDEISRGLLDIVRLVAGEPADVEPATAGDTAAQTGRAARQRQGLRFWR
ncbi:MAG TPA: AAA family ATPase [Chloroflexota bacterium]|nr:AAA family ATPase [Chloroflexota bacterium]